MLILQYVRIERRSLPLETEFDPWNAGLRTSGFVVAMKEVFMFISGDYADLRPSIEIWFNNAIPPNPSLATSAFAKFKLSLIIEIANSC